MQKNLINLGDQKIAVYASPKISAAMETITADMTLMQGVKLLQVLEAVYYQGTKDGARTAFEKLAGAVKEVEKAVPHRNPGKPKKK
jgi:hypothetical protein